MSKKVLEFLFYFLVLNEFFKIGEGRKLFAILKSEVTNSKLFHIPFVMFSDHSSFGLLSTHSHLLLSNSFG